MKQVKTNKQGSKGFTVIEILVVIVVIGILVSLIVSTYASVQRNQRNQTRETDIVAIYDQLEGYYVENSVYPTLSDMNNATWLSTNMKNLKINDLRDPSSNLYSFASKPQKNAYSYEVTASDGSSCNDKTVLCAHYTLTATLENSVQTTYVKSSLN